MKLPGYLRQVGKPELAPDGRSLIFTFEVNRRHPGFWLLIVYRTNGRALASLHARRTGHEVACEQVASTTYNRRERP